MNKFLLLAVAAFLLLGCAKKNSQPPQGGAFIVGKWAYKTDTLRTYENNVLTDTEVLNDPYTPYFQFNDDGSGLFMHDESGAGATERFTYSVANNIITMNFPQQLVSGVLLNARVQTATIKQHANNTLTIDFDEVDNNGGVKDEHVEIVFLISLF